jgi:2,4'-dihydroxyacetophenone dioxygenase
MSNTTAPVPATTSTGVRLPLLALPQKRLLTLNESDIPSIKDTVAPGIHMQILRLDFEHNEWVVLVTFAPGTSLPLHYHTGPAEVYTLKGRWVYGEFPDQPQTAGSYLYEPGGSVHTLYVPDSNIEDTVLFVRVSGANINFDDNGLLHSIVDTLTIRYIADELSAARHLTAPIYIAGAETAVNEPSRPDRIGQRPRSRSGTGGNDAAGPSGRLGRQPGAGRGRPPVSPSQPRLEPTA